MRLFYLEKLLGLDLQNIILSICCFCHLNSIQIFKHKKFEEYVLNQIVRSKKKKNYKDEIIFDFSVTITLTDVLQCQTQANQWQNKRNSFVSTYKLSRDKCTLYALQYI